MNLIIIIRKFLLYENNFIYMKSNTNLKKNSKKYNNYIYIIQKMFILYN